MSVTRQLFKLFETNIFVHQIHTEAIRKSKNLVILSSRVCSEKDICEMKNNILSNTEIDIKIGNEQTYNQYNLNNFKQINMEYNSDKPMPFKRPSAENKLKFLKIDMLRIAMLRKIIKNNKHIDVLNKSITENRVIING
jgi:hypothetical protein